MSHTNALAHHLPYLRRFARALTGSQKCGDALAVAAIHMFSTNTDRLDQTTSIRVRLYRSLISTFMGPVGQHLASLNEEAGPDAGGGEMQMLQGLGLEFRMAFLLSSLEGFSREEIALTLGLPLADVTRLLLAAQNDLSKQRKTEILIIEDEVFIARDLARIVTSLGHKVLARVRTQRAALEAIAVRRPGLILADVQLADGSNGIDAVHQILASGELPVIFITAYPDRLLTGLRPEPTFLISKPFSVDEVRAAISQVLFFGNRARRTEVEVSQSPAIIPLNARGTMEGSVNLLPC
ncbi:MAG: response regulator [Hyphomicrobiaceae bacterium]